MKKSFLKPLAILGAAVFSVSCASETYQIPEGYTGATARIESTGKPLTKYSGEVFYVHQVNGAYTKHSPVDSHYGRRTELLLSGKSLVVPCRELKLELVADQVFPADGDKVINSLMGKSMGAWGEVTFTPKPGGDYKVMGTMTPGYSGVWIIDKRSGKVVSEKVD